MSINRWTDTVRLPRGTFQAQKRSMNVNYLLVSATQMGVWKMVLGSLLGVLVYVLLFLLVLGLIWWAGSAVITLLPPPIQQVARVVLIVIIALACVAALLGELGPAGLRLH